MNFPKPSRVENLKKFIKDNFEVELPVSGGWGYSEDDIVFIEQSNLPIKQIEHIFATIRANISMNLLLPKEDKYGGINLKEKSREEKDGIEIVEYIVEAIKNDIYEELINEYKAGYGKDDFDMEAHFKKREDATLRVVERFYFKIA